MPASTGRSIGKASRIVRNQVAGKLWAVEELLGTGGLGFFVPVSQNLTPPSVHINSSNMPASTSQYIGKANRASKDQLHHVVNKFFTSNNILKPILDRNEIVIGAVIPPPHHDLNWVAQRVSPRLDDFNSLYISMLISVLVIRSHITQQEDILLCWGWISDQI
ncbi:hypothetical protein K435DRAFT_810909 [Dendrothele bispora CBS 962.96]|uniref:Uncharacterized protein n=1 Tax=Dendrothele bispora (strain CBS 962.96) TaxID=1314807 RepID=A0A4S8KTW7_DENBC|nr:hypothetical protein K435DRAFT_810909 [Dendrothele bispora CBS 962.96]